MRRRTIDLPGVRALHDTVGPAGTLEIINRLDGMTPGTTVHAHYDGEWADIFPGTPVTTVGATSRHIRIHHRIGDGVSMGDDLVLMRPTCRAALDMRASAIIATVAVGRPLTDLISHPVLDNGMTVDQIGTSDTMETWMLIRGSSRPIGGIRKILRTGARP